MKFNENDVIQFIKYDLPTTIMPPGQCIIKCYLFFNSFRETRNDEKSIEQIISDYYLIWESTIEYLYKKYLPNIEFTDSIDIEFTPFTYFVASTNTINFVEVMNFSDEDINYLNELFKIYESKYKNITLSNNISENANKMFSIVIFPPIMQLNTFYKLAYTHNSNYFKTLYETFSNQTVELPPYETNIGLFFGSHFLSQRTYERVGKLDGLLACKELESIRDKLLNVANECSESTKVDIHAICPECGERHNDIRVEKDAIFFAHVSSSHSNLLVPIGFNYFEDYIEDITEAISRLFLTTPDILNSVKDAKCIILVEGATEESSIPLLALKYNKPLASMKIHVWNSTSKQQVVADFRKIKDNLHEIKICVLLDSDAKKEKDDLERMIQGKKDKYSLFFIDKGTFEDLIPIEYIIGAFNDLYKLDKPIKVEDLDQNKEILGQLERKLFESCSGNLDKVKFIKKAVEQISQDKIPQLIKDLVDDAYKLVGK
ncbi:TOPRIM nucleotidyl transferase/hydrolase domain-containing protein [Acetobacterium carbinolicum]|uniref:TOPRIM nucleotidyl transferase/hydrolase domain-containing protein n=1 Tax=Acetobacterium carbinolicum TaxID=52690 RepID=UPI0039C8EC68